MPDREVLSGAPRNWSDAFAALPPESAPADGWARLSARLPPARRAPARRATLRRFAIAAALALAVVLPARRVMQPAGTLPQAPMPPVVARVDAGTLHASSSQPTDDAPANTQPPATPRDAATASVETRAPPRNRPTARAPAATRAPSPSAPATLDTLYSESARLEAVLAQMPEARMSNAATEALSESLQERVARIDVALSQPAVADDARAELWQQRVDALRQLTGVTATQRWLVARGDVPASDTQIY